MGKGQRLSDEDQQLLERVKQYVRAAPERRQRAGRTFERLQVSRKRMAAQPPVARLHWVVEFTRRDLARAHPGELEALGDDLRGLVSHSLPKRPGYRMTLAPIPPADLLRYQVTITRGIRGLLGDPPREWAFPAEPRVVVSEIAQGRRRKSNRRRFAVLLGGDETAAILGGVANLIAEVGEHLRLCLGCKQTFVAGTKQARYCSPSCSQRARNAKRA